MAGSAPCLQCLALVWTAGKSAAMRSCALSAPHWLPCCAQRVPQDDYHSRALEELLLLSSIHITCLTDGGVDTASSILLTPSAMVCPPHPATSYSTRSIHPTPPIQHF